MRRLAVALVLALLMGAALPAGAEDGLLPPSALLLLEQGTLMTGDLEIVKPDAKYTKMDAGEAEELRKAIESYQPPEESLLKNRSQYYYYYEHLEPVAREIYDLMLQVAHDPVSAGNCAVMMTDIDPDSLRFGYAYYRAWYAMVFDHPELFWLYNTSEGHIGLYGDGGQVNGKYLVYFRMAEPFPQFEEQMNTFNAAADAFLADIDRSGTQYDVALRIHDKLIDMMTYDTDLCNNPERDRFHDLGHTAYGALVANSLGTPNYAVCDGYSLAYEYLLQQCGIPVAYIGGYGGSKPDNLGGHAWNVVNIEGEWYEVDSTWDDNQIDDVAHEEAYQGTSTYPYIMEVIHDPEMREKLSHYLFLVSTDQMEHYVTPEGVDWVYRFDNGLLDMTPNSYHKRDGADMVTGEEMDDPYGGVIFLAPRAEKNYAR